MMSDLLESLDKVDKSVKRNNMLDEDFADIVRPSQMIKPENRPRF